MDEIGLDPDELRAAKRVAIATGILLLSGACALFISWNVTLQVGRVVQPKPAPAETTSYTSTAGATLDLSPITSEDVRDDASIKRFLLHIPIKALSKEHIDVKDLVIHVLFYDVVGGNMVVQTGANVKSRWATPPANWIKSDTEELAVEYQLPKPSADSGKSEDRKYYGYIVRIYYKSQLQASAGQPRRLVQQYPPSATLPLPNVKNR